MNGAFHISRDLVCYLCALLELCAHKAIINRKDVCVCVCVFLHMLLCTLICMSARTDSFHSASVIVIVN